ncbi:unnamed protein product [Parascedosporium putredinis]|uniref:Altered inheritance of mitochondria protein 11 n=1 Tax=Parascedosporium putredinis TaxID=1442378 RepID=A0A9P1GVM6_9PEZI|nr:unnamed protein product [Parascedosporium putredinis]CAI7987901.1 unnamed protein product [Parascedosporium putredinis]
MSQTPSAPSAPFPPRDRSLFSARARKQLGLFFMGATFTMASLLVTRRAIVRKQIAARLKIRRLRGGRGLGLATLNVLSFTMVAAGGLSYAFDLSNGEDLKRWARGRVHTKVGEADAKAEKELEEWASSILTKIGKIPAQDGAEQPAQKDT